MASLNIIAKIVISRQTKARKPRLSFPSDDFSVILHHHITTTMIQNDTICALATATGGALGIIRVSGPQAISVAAGTCRGISTDTPANTIHYAHITSSDGETLDEVMVSIFRAPHSYTGEDSVEISCHGSRYILSKVLELLVHQGCRMANPGEFTQRAFLNGKMDLSQAEAVADLIASTNRATHQMALSQLRGNFSSELSKLRDQLLHLTTLLELELDFSDHEELEFANRAELLVLTQKIDDRICQLAHSFETGRALKQGIPVAIVGKSNVGKSTLLNKLLRDDRAIVSDIHGTTRDTIEDTIDINGITFRFIDTAGIRQTSDTIEQIGIDRTYQDIEKARIVLWLIDSQLAETEINDIRKHTEGKKLIIVHNKIDELKDKSSDSPSFVLHGSSLIQISAKYGTNLNQLETAIYEAANIPTLAENEVIVTSARHYEALQRAHEGIQRVLDGMNLNLSGDLLSEDLRLVLSELAEITGGAITSQETLNNIFSHFCIGK